LTHKIAGYHQRELDRHGVLYFSEQGYDDFYPGKGSTYPDLHGTVGILFEQASARGHPQENPNALRTFAAAIRNQGFTSFSTLDAAVGLREELLALQRDHARETAALAAKSKVRAYVFGDDADPARAQAFLALLAQHRIEVRPLTGALEANGQSFQPGAAWVVPVAQPQFRLVHEIFVERTTFEDNVFYDVSAWTLPHAFNLPFAAVEAAPLAGDALAGTPVLPAGEVVAPDVDYAFVFNWNGYYAPRALLRLQQAGVLVRGLTDESADVLVADGTRVTLHPGAVLIPLGPQPEKTALIRELVATIAREDAVTVYGCATGLTPAGVDFGSASFAKLDLPKVALIVGQGADPQEIGAAWHVLDQRLGLTPTLLDTAQLGRANLSRYSFIMLADGWYADVVSEKTVSALKEWVKDGGTLFLTGRAVEWAARKELAAIEFEAEKTDPKAPPPARQPYASGRDREALNLVSGAVVAAAIDVTHALGYGFNGARVYFCRANMLRLKPAKSAYETPSVYAAAPLRSGYISAENQERIANTAAVLALTSGKGAVVALCLDLHLRQNGSSLQAVLRQLWSSHGRWTRGYSSDDLVRAFAQHAPDLAQLLPRWLDQLDDPDLDGYLSSVGLQLEPEMATTPWSGLQLRAEASGLLAQRVWRSGPGEQAGVMVGDELLALDGERLRQPEQFSAALRSGACQELLIARRSRLHSLKLRCAEPSVERYRLQRLPEASADCLERQQQWLQLMV
ncbi:MAG: hypothetical protein ACO3DQ_10250, partial [Cephaloticoccus sp.]